MRPKLNPVYFLSKAKVAKQPKINLRSYSLPKQSKGSQVPYLSKVNERSVFKAKS